MKLKKIKYADLNDRAQETYNFQKLSGVLVEYGYATNWLNVDFESADFIAAHFNGIDILKIQLKGRVTIDKKYSNKNIYISFPIKDQFYLILHDELVNLVKLYTNWLQTSSWKDMGGYSSKSPSKALKKELEKYRLVP